MNKPAFAPIYEPERVVDPLRSALENERDELLAELPRYESEQARIEANRARDLARIAVISDLLAGVPGLRASPTQRDMARRSTIAEVACLTKRSEYTVSRMINESEILIDSLPATMAALESGSVSYAHARALAGQAVSLPEQSRRAFEEVALPLAESHTAGQLFDQARRLRERMHPESITKRTAQANGERTMWVDAERDGMATIHHHLRAVDAVAIHDRVEKTARAMRSPDDDRTHSQRCSDVLRDFSLGRAPVKSVSPEQSGDLTELAVPPVTPTIVITIPATTLVGCDDEPAELHGYGPIDPVTARHIAAQAPTFLRALVHPATGEILDVRRSRYRPPSELRTALLVDDETCRAPLCGRKAMRCELDHTRAWADGGETKASNLAHLCSRHHHLKHEGGWAVRAVDESPPPGVHGVSDAPASVIGMGSRELEWTSPRGARYRTRPGRLAANAPLTRPLPDDPPF